MKNTPTANCLPLHEKKVPRSTLGLHSVGQHSIPGNENRQRQFEYGSSRLGTFEADAASVILEYLLADRKPESDAVLFSVADKGLKQLLSNRLGNSGPVVFNTDFDRLAFFTKPDFDTP